MTLAQEKEVTLLLKAWTGGDDCALDRLIPIVYDELRRMAHRQMSNERAGHSLQSDALINEAILRFLNTKSVQWNNRSHFFAFFSQLMRRILVDHARSRCRIKRGGANPEIALNSSTKIKSNADANIARLDDALSSLAEIDKRKAKIVELRFFGGFSVEETAEALGTSVRTVMNDWKFTKAWLLHKMESR